MRIALDASAVPTRVAGAGRYVMEIARRLPEAGAELVLVTRRSDVARWRACSPNAEVAPVVPDGRASRLIVEAWQLGQSTVARDASVWHGPHYTMPHRGTTPAVVTVHDLTFFTHPQFHERAKVVFFRRAIAYAVRHARVLICVSDFTANQMREIFPAHGPIVVAPHGVDLERFAPEDERSVSEPVSVPYVLFVGTIEPRKGLATLLGAFAHLARTDPTVELWIAGQSGWGRELGESVDRHVARSRIRQLGFVSDAELPALLRRARAVAYPSFVEGFGLPVLEALACGAPVVTSSGTVMADVAGDAAFLIVPGDEDGLAGALVKILAFSNDERRRVSAQARARAELFTWTTSVERHLEAYDLASRA